MALDPTHTDPRALFHAPEGYPGLITRDVRTRRLHLRVEPTFTPRISWTLYEAADGWWVRRVVWQLSEREGARRPGDTYAAEAQLHAATVTAALDALSAIMLRPFLPRDGIGLDGTTFHLQRTSRFASCSLGWWHTPPDGWEPLAVWFEDMRALCEAALPRATDWEDMDPARRGTHDTSPR
jgi:hypothetical protein